MLFDINRIVAKELDDMKIIYKRVQEQIERDIKLVYERDGITGKKGESLIKVYTSDGSRYKKFFRSKGKQRIVRIGGADNAEVIRIKQRRFNDEICRRLKKNIDLLEKISGKFLLYDPESIDDKLGAVYKDMTGLVNKAPGIIDMTEWRKIIKKNGYKMPDDPNIAPDGLETRSKSEIIVYCILKGYDLVIKYDYEITLIDETGHKVSISPDFIILCNDGSLIIIEHLGFMDDPQYLDKKIKRIHLLQINGYKLNDNLFLTSDYAKGKIDAKVIDELVRKMILPRAKGIAC